MDVDTIAPGQDYVVEIERRIAACDVLLALIGNEWLAASSPAGRRLDDPADFVRREISAALTRGVLVIPVLVEGAPMPQESALPPALRPLARRQAFPLSDARFAQEVEELMAALEGGSLADRDPSAGRDQAGERTRAAASEDAGGRSPPARAPGKPQSHLRARVPFLALLLTLVLAAAAISVVRIARKQGWMSGDSGLSGTWQGTVTPETGQPFDLVLVLQQTGRSLSGSVEFPTGTGRIIDGRVDGADLHFATVHTPDFEDREVTTFFDGQRRGNEIRFDIRYETFVRRLVARRR